MRLALLAAAAVFATAAAAQGAPPPASVEPGGQLDAKAAIVECDRLASYLEQTPGAAGLSLAEVHAWRESLDATSCRDALRRLAGEGDAPAHAVGEPAATGALPPPTQAIEVEDLRDLPVYNDRNEQIGTVDSVVMGIDGKAAIVVADGGFLGIAEKRAVLPSDRFAYKGDRLVAPGLTAQAIRALPDYAKSRTYKRMLDNESAELRLSR